MSERFGWALTILGACAVVLTCLGVGFAVFVFAVAFAERILR